MANLTSSTIPRSAGSASELVDGALGFSRIDVGMQPGPSAGRAILEQLGLDIPLLHLFDGCSRPEPALRRILEKAGLSCDLAPGVVQFSVYDGAEPVAGLALPHPELGLESLPTPSATLRSVWEVTQQAIFNKNRGLAAWQVRLKYEKEEKPTPELLALFEVLQCTQEVPLAGGKIGTLVNPGATAAATKGRFDFLKRQLEVRDASAVRGEGEPPAVDHLVLLGAEHKLSPVSDKLEYFQELQRANGEKEAADLTEFGFIRKEQRGDEKVLWVREAEMALWILAHRAAEFPWLRASDGRLKASAFQTEASDIPPGRNASAEDTVRTWIRGVRPELEVCTVLGQQPYAERYAAQVLSVLLEQQVSVEKIAYTGFALANPEKQGVGMYLQDLAVKINLYRQLMLAAVLSRISPAGCFTVKGEVSQELSRLLTHLAIDASQAEALHSALGERVAQIREATPSAEPGRPHAIDYAQAARQPLDEGTVEALRQAGLWDTVEAPLKQDYTAAVAFGGHLARTIQRLENLAAQWERGVRFPVLVLHSGERALTEKYGETSEALRAALNGAQAPDEPLPQAEIQMLQWLVKHRAGLPREWQDGTVKIEIVAAPLRADGTSPSTEDGAVILVRRLGDLLDNALFGSSQPYIQRQVMTVANAAVANSVRFGRLTGSGPEPLERTIEPFLVELLRLSKVVSDLHEALAS